MNYRKTIILGIILGTIGGFSLAFAETAECPRSSYIAKDGTCTPYGGPDAEGKTHLIQSLCPLSQFSVGNGCFQAPQACSKRHGNHIGFSYDGVCWCEGGHQFDGEECVFIDTSNSGRDETLERIKVRSEGKTKTLSSLKSARVSKVVDGDTIEVILDGQSESIRIVGINAPELEPVQCFAEEAKERLSQLVEGKVVNFVKNGEQDRDEFSQLFRYIEIGSIDIGAEMIKEGFAAADIDNSHVRNDAYVNSERAATQAKKGMWRCPDESEIQLIENDSLFTDISSTHPYIEAITWGKEQGIIDGYEDGSFKPEGLVNRAEFLKMVLIMKGIDVSISPEAYPFSDVDPKSWFAPAVSFALQNGIVQGYPDGTFRPEQNVSLAELLKMTYLTLGVTVDVATEGEWFQPYLTHAKTHQTLFTNEIQPDWAVTRKDVMWILHKLAVPSVENGSGSSL